MKKYFFIFLMLALTQACVSSNPNLDFITSDDLGLSDSTDFKKTKGNLDVEDVEFVNPEDLGL